MTANGLFLNEVEKLAVVGLRQTPVPRSAKIVSKIVRAIISMGRKKEVTDEVASAVVKAVKRKRKKGEEGK